MLGATFLICALFCYLSFSRLVIALIKASVNWIDQALVLIVDTPRRIFFSALCPFARLYTCGVLLLHRQPHLGPCHSSDARARDAACSRQKKSRKDSCHSSHPCCSALVAVCSSTSCGVDKLPRRCAATTTTWTCAAPGIGGLSTVARPAANRWMVQWSTTWRDASSGSSEPPSRRWRTTARACASSAERTSRTLMRHGGQRMSTGAWMGKPRSPCRSPWCRHRPPTASSS
uniref:Putative secreted protein n=1 Tax=Ixodes ricinus TaxID=34613 RepID=A0A147BEU5_IXORI